MHDAPEPLPIRCPGPEGCARLRGVFDQAGYTGPRICEALHVASLFALREHGTLPLLHFTRGGSAFEGLLRLFLIGVPLDLADARRAVAPTALEEWLDAGLIRALEASAVSSVQVLPHDGLVVAADPGWPLPSPLPFDHVAGVSTTSLKLADHTIRRRVPDTLDLGTGCGIQALLAARHSDRVTAVDRNPRAVAFAEFNARLNGLANVACARGDWFEPVRGRQFDLVVANPPFVISPENSLWLRDGGLPRDDLCRNLARTAPAHLREGGYFQMLCNWVHERGRDWRDRLREWFEGCGCDVWVLLGKTLDPAVYAASWLQQFEADAPERGRERFDDWLSYYAREHIEAISYGLVAMRRAGGRANWLRLEEAPEMIGPCGAAIDSRFRRRDFLESIREDEAVLRAVLRPAAGTYVQNRLQPGADGWALAESRIGLSSGLAFGGVISSDLLALLAACRGARPLGAVFADVAARLGRPPGEVAAACLPVVRRLVEQGFLVPDEWEG